MENPENLDDQDFGAFPTLETLKALAEWAPVISAFQAVLSADTPREKAASFMKLAIKLAGKTRTHVDDEALEHLEATLKTPEGAAFIDWLAVQFGVGK